MLGFQQKHDDVILLCVSHYLKPENQSRLKSHGRYTRRPERRRTTSFTLIHV